MKQIMYLAPLKYRPIDLSMFSETIDFANTLSKSTKYFRKQVLIGSLTILHVYSIYQSGTVHEGCCMNFLTRVGILKASTVR